MANKEKAQQRRASQTKNTAPPKLNDDGSYEIITEVNVEGSNVCVQTETSLDGKLMFACDVDWYGLPPDMLKAVEKALQKSDVKSATVTTKSFRKVCNNWAKQIKALMAINSAGQDIIDNQGKGAGAAGDEPRESLTL